jgi:hypothetical protein
LITSIAAGRSRWVRWLLPLLAAAPALGHVIYGRITLSQLVAGSEVVVIAKIVDPEAALAIGEKQRRPVIAAEFLQVLKGEAARGPALVARHGHGYLSYARGEQALLFLTDIERHRELNALAETGEVRYVSLQEHGANFRLATPQRQALIDAVRAYVGLDAIREVDDRLAALQALTMDLLRSPDERLASSAARDLAATGALGAIATDQVPELVAIVQDEGVPVGVRIAVLAELEHQALVEAAPHWARLVAESEGADLRAAARAAGAHPSGPVAVALIEVMRTGAPEDAVEAAVALGWPGNDPAVPALTRALESKHKRLALAAIRGLSGIGTLSAHKALTAAAESHPDPDIRRRAGGATRQ